nr:hypothetical protein BaRGS_022827 [Batillaria attramentaria]
MKDIHQEDSNDFVPDNSTGTVFIRIAVPELKNQKCLQFQLDDTVWQAKQRILAAFAKDLRDALNYGLYLPPMNGRAGKFLEEERFLKEYPLQGPIGFLEFKYKRRVYKLMQLNPRKLKQLHSKSNLKHFLEFVRNGNVERINKMTSKGLDPNFHDQDNGETPLTVAATLGRDKTREVMITLVSGGAHIDFRNRSGLTAMHRAAIVGNAEAIKTLLDLGASADYKDGRGLTPLYYSVSNDTNQACTEMLLHERAYVGTHDDQGWCEIHQACRYGRVQHLEHLLFYGAELDVQNASGNTPLHVCAAYNQEACARVLLFRGADRSIMNYSNQTAYQVAVIANNMDLADLIKNHKEEDVVPIREMPKYSERRKNASMTPSMRSLIRSRSDPRLHASVLEEQMLQASSQQNLTTLSDFYDTASYNPSYASYPSSHDYNSDSPCSLSVSSASSGPMLGVTDQGLLEGRTLDGREGNFPPTHVDEVQLRKADSLGDLVSGDIVAMHRNTLAALVMTERESLPRTAVLHRSPEGYGFVLRGAKSHTHVGNLNFQPTPEFPALQYLDSVDPGSQAERAGLRTGDFILEINGENVVRASHERVVQLIRSSGNTLTLKVVSVRTTTETPASPTDWFKHQDGSRTLPTRKKQAPLPPRRDPHTSLSYSKATSKSMSEGLAEIEKLDQTIAEFDQQNPSARRHSMHTLEITSGGGEQQKVASVRAAHTMKRVSVVEMEEMTDSNTPPPVPLKPAASEPRSGTLSKMSPSALRIKKYHKKGSATMERSKSTPDLADIEFGMDGSSGAAVMVEGRQAAGAEGGQGRVNYDRMSSTWSKSHSMYVPVIPGLTVDDMKRGPYSQAEGDTPEVPQRVPMPKRRAPDPPAKGEVVRISTVGGAQSTIYANVSEEIAARKKDSPYESSFRPGTSAQLTTNPNVMTQSLEQAKLQHRKSASVGSMETGHYHGRPGVSFAEDRIYETAQTFIKNHPNAMLLVTADIHDGKVQGPVRPSVEKTFYEPEPDYDVDSDEDKVGSSISHSSVSDMSSAKSSSMAAPVPASGPIPTSDIMAAVAQRQVRMENEGPRLTDRQTSAPALANQSIAEKARQDYLQRMNSSAEIKPASHNAASSSPAGTKPVPSTAGDTSAPPAANSKHTMIEVQPARHETSPVKVSIKDKIANFEAGSLDMSQYKPSFARNNVDGQRLQALERNDYIELGVTQVGHRMDLQRSIKRLMLRNGPS